MKDSANVSSEFVSIRSTAALLPLKELPTSIIMIYEGVSTTSLIHRLSFSKWSVSQVAFPHINMTPPPRLMITVQAASLFLERHLKLRQVATAADCPLLNAVQSGCHR